MKNLTNPLFIAELCCAQAHAVEPDHIRDSLIVELCAVTGDGPVWVEIFPAPDKDGWVEGRDGRRFYLPDPQSTIAHTMERGVDLQLDIEHASELKAPKGEPAPAAGWFTQLRVAANGGIEGLVDFTATARAYVDAREYRYLSPVPMVHRVTRAVHRFSSVALTNKPNLHTAALNHEGVGSPEDQPKTKHHMTPEECKELCRELGIAEGSLSPAIIAAAKKATTEASLNREATPSLEKFIPRADYNAMEQRCLNAEQTLKQSTDDQLEAEINTEIETAVKAGKIAPASADFYKENCRRDGGLESFRGFVKDAPVIVGASGLDGKKPREVGAELNSEQLDVCEQMGVDPEEFKKTLDAESA
jgi:phage I-like protein